MKLEEIRVICFLLAVLALTVHKPQLLILKCFGATDQWDRSC